MDAQLWSADMNVPLYGDTLEDDASLLRHGFMKMGDTPLTFTSSQQQIVDCIGGGDDSLLVVGGYATGKSKCLQSGVDACCDINKYESLKKIHIHEKILHLKLELVMTQKEEDYNTTRRHDPELKREYEGIVELLAEVEKGKRYHAEHGHLRPMRKVYLSPHSEAGELLTYLKRMVDEDIMRQYLSLRDAVTTGKDDPAQGTSDVTANTLSHNAEDDGSDDTTTMDVENENDNDKEGEEEVKEEEKAETKTSAKEQDEKNKGAWKALQLPKQAEKRVLFLFENPQVGVWPLFIKATEDPTLMRYISHFRWILTSLLDSPPPLVVLPILESLNMKTIVLPSVHILRRQSDSQQWWKPQADFVSPPSFHPFLTHTSSVASSTAV